MKKLIAYSVMAAIIATLFCACGYTYTDDRYRTAPGTEPYVTAPGDGMVNDRDGVIGNETRNGYNNGANNGVNTEANNRVNNGTENRVGNGVNNGYDGSVNNTNPSGSLVSPNVTPKVSPRP